MEGQKFLKIDELHPRVGMGMGATIPLPDYANVKPYVSLEIDMPDDLGVDGTFSLLEELLTEKFHELADLLVVQLENR